ncbi:MAG: hypothetical protein ACKPKO_17395, partial [Candidatus Fonsibacter sp.]
MAAADDEPTERARVVYVVSRVIKFTKLNSGDDLAYRLRQLYVLIQRDTVQNGGKFAHAKTNEASPAVHMPAWSCWPKSTSKRAIPAEGRWVPVANRFAALSDEQGLSGGGSNHSGNKASKGGHSV